MLVVLSESIPERPTLDAMRLRLAERKVTIAAMVGKIDKVSLALAKARDASRPMDGVQKKK